MSGLSTLLVFAASWSLVAAHTVITYPGWRGNNLHTTGTLNNNTPPDIKPGSLGMNWDESTHQYTFPYGMQWMYPCGGMPTTQNRTKWPVTGGAVAIQPGWFPGHSQAFFYINLGLGTEPPNMSHPMVPAFAITGPTNHQYPGTFCLPQVPLPANISVNIGDNATIQVIETAQHGAALYSCVDITFADPKDVEQVNSANCYNSTGPGQNIGFNLVFTTKSLTAAAPALSSWLNSYFALVPTFAALVVGLWW